MRLQKCTTMLTAMLLRLARWTMATSVVLALAAMVIYPGGTLRNPSAAGYSFFSNFLSDLGLTVALGGEPNGLGASLFVASFGLLAISCVACALGFVRFHTASSRARPFALAGGAGMVFVGAGLFGAALSPANVCPALHMQFVTLASSSAPWSVLLFAIASKRDGRLPLGTSIAWVALSLIVTVWFAMRWGPGGATETGLTVQVTAQKLVALVVVGAVAYQSSSALAASRNWRDAVRR